MKILIQLEIEYETYPKNNEDYVSLIRKIKDHFENYIPIPEIREIPFKSLGKVGISKIIQ